MTVFIDTSYLLALVLADDDHHDRAVAWQLVIKGPLVTTEYVLLEVMDALTTGTLRNIAVRTMHLLRESPTVSIIPASTQLMQQGIGLFESRPDKQWGLTDCISFVIMQQKGLTSALTSDKHFVQAGFDALLQRDSE